MTRVPLRTLNPEPQFLLMFGVRTPSSDRCISISHPPSILTPQA